MTASTVRLVVHCDIKPEDIPLVIKKLVYVIREFENEWNSFCFLFLFFFIVTSSCVGNKEWEREEKIIFAIRERVKSFVNLMKIKTGPQSELENLTFRIHTEFLIGRKKVWNGSILGFYFVWWGTFGELETLCPLSVHGATAFLIIVVYIKLWLCSPSCLCEEINSAIFYFTSGQVFR